MTLERPPCALIGAASAPPWLETEWLLPQFGSHRTRDVCQFMDVVPAGVGQLSIREALRQQIFLGSDAFIDRMPISTSRCVKCHLDNRCGSLNTSLDGKVRRAIDLKRSDPLDERAFRQLIRAAAALNRGALGANPGIMQGRLKSHPPGSCLKEGRHGKQFRRLV